MNGRKVNHYIKTSIPGLSYVVISSVCSALKNSSIVCLNACKV